MWPGFWFLALVPLVAAIPAIDAAIGFSRVLARAREDMRPDAALLGMVLAGCFALIAILAISGHLSLGYGDYIYRDLVMPPGEVIDEGRRQVESYLGQIDLAFLLFGGVAAIALAAVQQRPMRIWLSLALLGNAGAVVWLVTRAPFSAWLKAALFAGAMSVAGLGAWTVYWTDFNYSVAVDNRSGRPARVEIELGGAALWDGVLASGERHLAYGRPKGEGPLRVTSETQGHFVQREIGAVEPRCVGRFAETGYIYRECPHHIEVAISPAGEIAATAQPN